MNLARELSIFQTLEGVLVLCLLLMTFSYTNINTAAATALALHRTKVHAGGGVDSKAFDKLLLTVCCEKLLGGLREYVIGNQPDTSGLLDAVERDKVEQLDQGTVAIIATGHIAITGTFIGGEHRRDGV